MARMHSKRHGKSKSRKPLPEEMGEPKDFDSKSINDIIIGYAKQGVSPSMIGQRLKSEHGMPYIKHYMGKRLGKILEEKGFKEELPADLTDLMKKAVNISEHLKTNKQDTSNTIKLRRIESKIWRLTKYYIRKGELPQGWRYDVEQAKLIVKRAA